VAACHNERNVSSLLSLVLGLLLGAVVVGVLMWDLLRTRQQALQAEIDRLRSVGVKTVNELKKTQEEVIDRRVEVSLLRDTLSGVNTGTNNR
jgi:uncharacterized membrane-anchored protein YhcB (DUF1043 family)